MYLTWLADALRDTGYPVVEWPGWRTNGQGGMRGAIGIVDHWTAGPRDEATKLDIPSRSVLEFGRAGLRGRLCNYATGFSGAFYVNAAGLGYHAGVSDWRGYTNLNYWFVGNEVESPGGFVYTDEQLDAVPRADAAVLRRMGRSAEWVAAHFEVANPPGRKPDGPARDMVAYRRKVKFYLDNPSRIRRGGVTVIDVKPKEWDDMASEAQVRAAVAAAIKAEVDPLRAEVKSLRGQVTELKGKLDRTGLRLWAVEDVARATAVKAGVSPMPASYNERTRV